MKKYGKILAALLALLLAAALCGCGGEKQASTPGGNQTVQPQGAAIALELVDEAEAAAGEVIELSVPVLEDNADNEILAGFKADIEAKLADWQQALGEGETLLVRVLSLDTENYTSVALTRQVIPDYGSDDDVYTYVYDKIIDKAMNEDLVMSIGGMTGDAIGLALEEYLNADQKWLSFTLAGYAMDENEQPVYFIQTDVAQEGADNWVYMFVLKDGRICGNLGQLIEEVSGK